MKRILNVIREVVVFGIAVILKDWSGQKKDLENYENEKANSFGD